MRSFRCYRCSHESLPRKSLVKREVASAPVLQLALDQHVEAVARVPLRCAHQPWISKQIVRRLAGHANLSMYSRFACPEALSAMALFAVWKQLHACLGVTHYPLLASPRRLLG